jgi:4-hydroxyphenylpyruvate dioxygenase
MGWKFADPHAAFQMALERGARPASQKDYEVPAIYGIGDSLIYFVSDTNSLEELGFPKTTQVVSGKGFLEIDHLTNNVYQGELSKWSKFYKDIFEFTDVRNFEIQGEKTGLLSYALRSADGSFCIPINEGTEKKSQINEYLDEYHGPGIQHLAFLSDDLLTSLKQLENTSIQTLDISPSYYNSAFSRVPTLREDKATIQKYNVLVDGDDDGYLLQIFTKNLFGPIFIELIQRRNHLSFGEGNFQSLFDSIERDQMKRGYL